MASGESSGRWDATGSWNDATAAQRREALTWVLGLSMKELVQALFDMAMDTNAFTLYQRKELLLEAADRIRRLDCC